MAEQTSPRVREVVVSSDDVGQRIDNFLRRELKGVPKGRIYRILRKGEVRVNKGRIKPEYRLRDGDRVRIPPIRTAETGGEVRPGEQTLALIERSILFEDNRLLVLNKPSGLAVHGGSGLSYGAIEALRVLRPNQPFLELVHRLDRDTSGCLLVAKKRSTLRTLHELLRGDGVDKRYLALVKGRWPRGGKVDAPLRKNVVSSGERIVKVSTDGKPALTLFRAVTTFESATLMSVKLVTGRTHQVRVHAQHAGHPLAGDDKYGDEAFNREMARLGLKRLFLHAASLRFTLPELGEFSFEAPLDPALENVLQRLKSEQ